MPRLGAASRMKSLANLPTPDAGDMTLGFKTDGMLYKKSPSGVETPVDGGVRWGVTSNWPFATNNLNVPVTYVDGLPPRVGDMVISTNGISQGDSFRVTRVASATTVDLEGVTGLRGPAGATGAAGITYTPVLTGTGMTNPSPGTYRKTSGSSNWDAQVYSKEGFQTCFVSLTPEAPVSTQYFMVGLNTDPTTDASYSSIDYCWYMTAGVWQIYESGGFISSVPNTTAAAGDVASVTYDGASVNYYINGILKRSVPRLLVPGQNFYLDSSFSAPSSSGITAVSFGPMGSSGGNGLNFVNRDYNQAIWGNQVLANGSQNNVTSSYTPAASRASANLCFVKWVLNGAATGNVNQAMDYYLQVSMNGNPWQTIEQTYVHNNGGGSPPMGTTMEAWLPMTPGTPLAFRVLMNVAGGGPTMNMGMSSVSTTFFQTVSPVGANPSDTGWINLTLLNGWVNYDSGLTSGGGGRVCQYRIRNGEVIHRGFMRSGTMGAVAWNIGPNARPDAFTPNDQSYPCASNNGYGQLGTNAGGGTVIVEAGTNVWFNISGLRYMVAGA